MTAGHPPVLVIGMHRSGTSLVARLLEEAGLFIGREQLAGHSEARFFLDLHDWLFTTAGAAWDHPKGLEDLLGDDDMIELAHRYVDQRLRSLAARSFTGWRQWRPAGLHGLSTPWGWKEPRTTLAMPLWERAFPALAVIHVTRHGVDVANSLMTRRAASIRYAKKLAEQRSQRYRIVEMRRQIAIGLGCSTMAESLALWETYVRAGESTVERLGDRALQFAYEDLLEDPTPIMNRMLEFIGLPSTPVDWEARVSASRRFAYREDEELRAAARAHHEILERNGYEP